MRSGDLPETRVKHSLCGVSRSFTFLKKGEQVGGVGLGNPDREAFVPLLPSRAVSGRHEGNGACVCEERHTYRTCTRQSDPVISSGRQQFSLPFWQSRSVVARR